MEPAPHIFWMRPASSHAVYPFSIRPLMLSTAKSQRGPGAPRGLPTCVTRRLELDISTFHASSNFSSRTRGHFFLRIVHFCSDIWIQRPKMHQQMVGNQTLSTEVAKGVTLVRQDPNSRACQSFCSSYRRCWTNLRVLETTGLPGSRRSREEIW